MINNKINPAKNTNSERVGAVNCITVRRSKAGFLFMKKYKYDVKAYNLSRRRTPSGVVSSIYDKQIRKSKDRGHEFPKYTRVELKEWVFNHPSFWMLYCVWVSSGYDKYLKPSCDRLDNSTGYTFDNLQIVTWRENMDNWYNELSIPIRQKTINGKIVGVYKSGEEASRKTGINPSSINSVVNGRRKTTGGFIWEKI